jgi:TonB family protein
MLTIATTVPLGRWSLYQNRDAAAQLGTAIFAIAVFAMTQSWSMHQEVVGQNEPISLSIMNDSVETEQKIQPPQPQRIVEQHKEFVPESDMPMQIQEKIAEKEEPATPVAEVMSKHQVIDPSLQLEALYVEKVRSYLASAKRYPTGREASLQRPAGKAKIWFVLARSGSLLEAGVELSSGSMLLDSTALSNVRRANYTAFPEGSWIGQTQHRFSVELDFIPPSS